MEDVLDALASTGQCKITRSFEASARVSKERGDSIQVYNLKALAPLVHYIRL